MTPEGSPQRPADENEKEDAVAQGRFAERLRDVESVVAGLYTRVMYADEGGVAEAVEETKDAIERIITGSSGGPQGMHGGDEGGKEHVDG